MDLLRDVQSYIESHALLEPGGRLVVGVSGGPDSVTLLHLLWRMAGPLGLSLHVAHLHHGIRGADADGDADFVAALAEAWELLCTVKRIDLPTIAARDKLALEEAARRARYAFLYDVARQTGATRIAVAHNADDQAETVLMHLLRGAGPAGLRGMLPSTRLRDYHMLPVSPAPAPDVHLIRPLLDTPRADIEAYCAEHHLETRFDRSNLDTTYYRNRLRHEVLPYLAQINPQIADRLRALSAVVQADYDLLHEFVSVAWDTLLVQACPDTIAFNLVGWREQPLSVQRALIRRATYKLCRELRNVNFVHIEEAVRLAQRGITGTQATLPHGLRLTIGYTTLTIAQEHALHLPPELPWLTPGETLPLAGPGEIALRDGWRLHVQDVPHWNLDAIANNVNPLVAWIDADALGDAPVLRTRRRGDRFQPQGMGGSTVRLSDLLINTKVPKLWRDHVPLLEADGHILWVVSVRVSERALVRPETQHVVYLRFHGAQAPSQNICTAHSN